MWTRVLPLLLFIGLALFFFCGLSIDSRLIPSVLINKSSPSFALKTLSHPENLFMSEKLKGKPYLLNVFASWCEACQTEHVVLLAIANSHQIALYGLDYKDSLQTVRQFLQELGNPYQEVFLDTEGQTALDFGVYKTPETFLIDAQGIVRYRWVGPLTWEVWKTKFLPLINSQ